MTTSRPKYRSAYAERLRAARDRLGLKANEVARRAGCPITTYSNCEGKSEGSAYTARLARQLRVDAYWLETGEGSMEPAGGAALAAELAAAASRADSLFPVVTEEQIRGLNRANAATVECLILHLLGQQAARRGQAD